jgi:trimeric autotransporter adhesin
VISGNGGNGVSLYEAAANQIAMNYIGTDVSGLQALGNGESGILVTSNSTQNMIGGQATGGNDPTNSPPIFVRPPQGNLISGNDADGVLIDDGATENTLSGNYIGTDTTGIAALGNTLDGVTIENADNNSLIGCTFQQDPFVFYNVISGNGGNGLRVDDANDTTIQANFFGLGADNRTPVGNTLNGVLVEGSSTRTLMGGPIPLGNVDSANGQNGIFVRDTASYFTTYNTFTGLAAFQTFTDLGNGANGMLITSTGGNNLIRTCVITENANDGILIAGEAYDVRVAGNIIGLDTNGNSAMGNKVNGVEVAGNAHNIFVGGPQPSFNIIPQNAISENGAYGVAVDGQTHDVTVNHSYIGTSLLGDGQFGNTLAGVYLAPGSYQNSVGSSDSGLLAVISNNGGAGILMRGTHDNRVVGTYIGLDALGTGSLGNAGAGIDIIDSIDNVIGLDSGATADLGNSLEPTGPGFSANRIAFNQGDGVFVESGTGNGIHGNSIYTNALLGIHLASGANQDQAAPTLLSAVPLSQSVLVTGFLSSVPNRTYLIEIYASEANDSSGKTLIGTLSATTNSLGLAPFVYRAALPPSGQNFITSTATNPSDNTSEFSSAASMGD